MKLSVPAKFLVFGAALVNPTVRALSEVMYQFERRFVVDHGKYARVFGGTVTLHRDAIQQTLGWFRQNAASPRGHDRCRERPEPKAKNRMRLVGVRPQG